MRNDMAAAERKASPVSAFVRMLSVVSMLALQGCADVNVPGTRNVNVPTPTAADEREEAVNDVADSVLYLPLGRDVLVPVGGTVDSLPRENIGPFELRGETLAGALQLILADYDVSLAFETDLGMTRTVTVANLRGPLNKVIETVCGLADLYCAYERDMVIVKEAQTFSVKIPPISGDTSFMQNISSGLQAITGSSPTIDNSTRTIIYKASHRTAELAERYFQRMRASTALIVFETYIWEVTLDSSNATGIRWDMFRDIGKFGTGITLSGTSAVGAIGGNAVSIGIPTTQSFAAGIPANRMFQFISRFGTAKTVSQPQITVLSGSQAKFRAATEDTFVSSFSETIDNGQSTVAVQTSTIDTGLNLTIDGAWDNSTVYAKILITLADADVGDQIPFGNAGDNNFIQLPESTERELETQVRVRPGDSILIAGLVQEEDRFGKEGFGLTKPFIPYGRSATTSNTELVFLLKPRVVVYTSPNEEEYYRAVRGAASAQNASFSYDFSPLKTPEAEMPADTEFFPVKSTLDGAGDDNAPVPLSGDIAPVTQVAPADDNVIHYPARESRDEQALQHLPGHKGASTAAPPPPPAGTRVPEDDARISPDEDTSYEPDYVPAESPSSYKPGEVSHKNAPVADSVPAVLKVQAIEEKETQGPPAKPAPPPAKKESAPAPAIAPKEDEPLAAAEAPESGDSDEESDAAPENAADEAATGEATDEPVATSVPVDMLDPGGF